LSVVTETSLKFIVPHSHSLEFILILALLSLYHSHLTLFFAPSVNGLFTYNPCNKSNTFILYFFYSYLFPTLSRHPSSAYIHTYLFRFQFSSHFSLSLSDFALLVILQSNVGSLSPPTSVSNKGVLVPTCNSLKLRRSSFSTSLRISHLTSSSNPSSRRRPGFLSPVRASAEVRVFTYTLCLVTAKISMFLTF